MESFNQILKKQCDKKNSSLCIGLDVDNKKLKNASIEYMKDYIFDIIDATINLCPIYKINFAFYDVINSFHIKTSHVQKSPHPGF